MVRTVTDVIAAQRSTPQGTVAEAHTTGKSEPMDIGMARKFFTTPEPCRAIADVLVRRLRARTAWRARGRTWATPSRQSASTCDTSGARGGRARPGRTDRWRRCVCGWTVSADSWEALGGSRRSRCTPDPLPHGPVPGTPSDAWFFSSIPTESRHRRFKRDVCQAFHGSMSGRLAQSARDVQRPVTSRRRTPDSSSTTRTSTPGPPRSSG